jgi:hypothetical protein
MINQSDFDSQQGQDFSFLHSIQSSPETDPVGTKVGLFMTEVARA